MKCLPFVLILVSLFFSTSVQAKKRQRPLDLLSVKPPTDLETCFAPDEPCAEKLIRFVDSAQTSIDVAVFDININELVDHLIVKAKKIKVRIVVDRRQAKGKHSAVPRLIQNQVLVRYGKQRGLMHNKFVIIDQKMVETGSFNQTWHASSSNEENQVYISSPNVVKRFHKRFEKMWSHAKAP